MRPAPEAVATPPYHEDPWFPSQRKAARTMGPNSWDARLAAWRQRAGRPVPRGRVREQESSQRPPTGKDELTILPIERVVIVVCAGRTNCFLKTARTATRARSCAGRRMRPLLRRRIECRGREVLARAGEGGFAGLFAYPGSTC
ncbi:hypothetical protein B0H11DRAFT_1901391 [Mycena galericulata]|nr:hypothetical protein B0H11DRAFT_1901391 [Mycena galericulata]